MRLSLLLSLLALPLISAPAWAQGEDAEDADGEEEEELDIDFSDDTFDLGDFDEEEEDDVEEVERLAEDADEAEDELPGADEEEDFGGDPLDDEFSFDGDLEELGEDQIGVEGQDNVGIYRDYVDEMDDLGAEEELINWERYLEEYPNTLFRDRIERRMDELTETLYGQRIEGPNSGYKDAKDREIELARTLTLENIDPRTHAHVAVEIGFPNYQTATLEAEWALARQMSVRAAYRSRYTGGSIELGAKYAFLKSARLQMIGTGILDVRYNTNPGYPAIRPQLGFGKIFDVGGGLHVQAQGGAEIESRQTGPFSMRYIGGANVTYVASDVVSVFVEGNLNYKISDLPGTYPNFQFHVVTFGIKFQPGKKDVHVGLAANVPVAYQYWGYHFGAVQADMAYYDDDIMPKFF